MAAALCESRSARHRGQPDEHNRDAGRECGRMCAPAPHLRANTTPRQRSTTARLNQDGRRLGLEKLWKCQHATVTCGEGVVADSTCGGLTFPSNALPPRRLERNCGIACKRKVSPREVSTERRLRHAMQGSARCREASARRHVLAPTPQSSSPPCTFVEQLAVGMPPET